MVLDVTIGDIGTSSNTLGILGRRALPAWRLDTQNGHVILRRAL
jgi:hypothetical protein